MVSINWCYKQKDGIKLIEPNNNLVKGYIEKAEDALGVMGNEKDKSLTWAISSCYYSMYYSLYAIMMKIGIKCEIHSCSLEFMKIYLNKFYSDEDIKIINKAFNLRILSQYYINKTMNKGDTEIIFNFAPGFIEKTKEILSKINEDDIKKIREDIRKLG